MRYFVTGATGFIGGKLARELVKRGHQVVTVARQPAKAADLQAVGVEVVQGDITDKASLRGPMTGTHGVYHVAGWYKVGVRDAKPGYEVNVNGTRNTLEVMRDLGIPKGVYTSTLAIYGSTQGRLVDENEPTPKHFDSEYDRTKSLAHFEVALPMMREGLPLVIVQPGLVYGPGDTSQIGEAFSQYLQRKLPMIATGATYAWAHVDDIVEGHILAMDKGQVGQSYIIAGEVCNLLDAFKLAAKITGVPIPGIQLGPGMVNITAQMMEWVNRIIPLEGQMHPETLRSLNATYIGSNARARRELGYSPRPLEVGMRETLLAEMARLGIKNATRTAG